MTRIAILADVHGNMPALEAVIADLESQGIDEVITGGDLVGRGPEGSRVVRRVRDLGWPGIRGNHEDYLLTFRKGRVPEEWRFTEEWAAARWMAAELGPDEARYIAALPDSLGRDDLRLVHGTPASNRVGIGPWTAPEELRSLLGEVAEDLLVCAHTHRPLLRDVETGRVVNVGSVGLPFNRDRRAQYAVFSRKAAGNPWEVELRQVDYDLDEILRTYDETGFLRHGGVTARLLRLELEHAAPLLVPFLEWTRTTGVEPNGDALDDFLAFYRPGEPLRDFFAKLRRLRDSG